MVLSLSIGRRRPLARVSTKYFRVRRARDARLLVYMYENSDVERVYTIFSAPRRRVRHPEEIAY